MEIYTNCKTICQSIDKPQKNFLGFVLKSIKNVIFTLKIKFFIKLGESGGVSPDFFLTLK